MKLHLDFSVKNLFIYNKKLEEFGIGKKNVKKGYKPRKHKKTRYLCGFISREDGIRTLIEYQLLIVVGIKKY